jgi:Zn-dependent peptidase ImmA (M78 family)
MPKLAKISSILVKLPPNQAIAGWDIDADRVMDFARNFGITNEIHFRWTSGQNRIGCHRLRTINGKRVHCITLSQRLDFAEAQDTMLHELCHAIQKDTVDINEWKSRRRAERATFGYQESLIEREAKEFAVNNLSEWGDVLYS